ncbi:putative holin-like toxin [Mammaliicoccus sciuri]|nr:putative holin-like toxin [Mammaliicoccus sciuri]
MIPIVDAIRLMIVFSSFIVVLIDLVITIMKLNTKK